MNMYGISVDKQIAYQNQNVKKIQENLFSAEINIKQVIGLDRKPILGNPAIMLNKQQVFYYSCHRFVIFNVITKQYLLICKDNPYEVFNINGLFNHQFKKNPKSLTTSQSETFRQKQQSQIKFIKNFIAINKHNVPYYLICAVEMTQMSLSLLLLNTQKIVKKTQSVNKEESLNVIKMMIPFGTSVVSLCHHSQKNYLYILLKNAKQWNNGANYLLIIDLLRNKAVMNIQIKTSLSTNLTQIIVLNDSREVIFVGDKYFRQWIINFNQKSIKETNQRNIERCVKQFQVIGWSSVNNLRKRISNIQILSKVGSKVNTSKELLKSYKRMNSEQRLKSIKKKVEKVCQHQGMLIVACKKHLVLIKNNELMKIYEIDQNLTQKIKKPLGIEDKIQNSLNEIYKMKFLSDELQFNEKSQPNNQVQLKDIQFTCITMLTQGQQILIATGTNSGTVLVYQIQQQPKIISSYQIHTNQPPITISSSSDGSIILISTNPSNSLHYLNRSSYHGDQQPQFQDLWGYDLSNQNIYCLESSPMRNYMISIGSDDCLKLWNFQEKQRCIDASKPMKMQAISGSMHPSGYILALNSNSQIKLMSIVQEEFFQICSTKNLHNCLKVQYTNSGHILLSLQNGRIKFYDPFTLKSLTYIQPEDMKISIISYKISNDDQYLFFQTSDFGIYRRKINLQNIFKSQNSYDGISFCHSQSQSYNTFYYDEKIQGIDTQISNLFIGFTNTKYMVIYSDYATNLITQFPIIDCHINNAVRANNLLFLGTNIGTIRVYNWPILEQHFCFQLINQALSKIRYLPPLHKETTVWMEGSEITNLHHLKFSNELIVSNSVGNLALLSFNLLKGGKIIVQEPTPEKKKLMTIINDLHYVQSSELQKRQRLIEKTQNDILKVQNQITKQKNIREEQLKEEQLQLLNTFELKNQNQYEQRQLCINKQLALVINYEQEYAIIQQTLKKDQQQWKQDFQKRKQQQKIEQLNKKCQMDEITRFHKQRIYQAMQFQKNQIKRMKQQFTNNINQIQKGLNQLIKGWDKQNRLNSPEQKYMQIQDFKDQQDEIYYHLNHKVQVLEDKLEKLRKQQYEQQQKMNKIQQQDEQLQRQFQKNIELYNQNRFNNLCLHSEVLKMQNQLIQRKEILKNKQNVAAIAYRQKYKLQNYKQLVKGSLANLQQKKQQIFQTFISKQTDIKTIFQQLTNQIKNYEEKKIKCRNLQQAKQYYAGQRVIFQKKIEEQTQKIKEIKRYLLLQGGQEGFDKKIFLQRENVQNSIKWLQKRVHHAINNEKKNVSLKQATIGLVLKQNTNLLQQCNLLRRQGRQYEKEIRNLSLKLREANNIMKLESKLRMQKKSLLNQNNKLEQIKDICLTFET